jgi:hypothetical protein
MPDLIRVKRELFGRVSDIEGIIGVVMQYRPPGKIRRP